MPEAIGVVVVYPESQDTSIGSRSVTEQHAILCRFIECSVSHFSGDVNECEAAEWVHLVQVWLTSV